MPEDDPPPDPVVELDPPVTEVAWTEAVVAQNLEVLFVCLAEDGAHLLRPIHADALRLGWPPTRHPGDLVIEAAERYELTTLLVHSTSWRFEESRLILTYVAAVEPPTELSRYLADEPVARVDLARGDALRPPTGISTGQVIEHAFRHLSWLVRDDPAVADALGGWKTFLDGYVPEPFRAFGAS